MRFNLAVSCLGSVANYKISPVLYNRSGTVSAALCFSAGLLAICLVGIVIMFVVDRWHSNLISNVKEKRQKRRYHAALLKKANDVKVQPTDQAAENTVEESEVGATAQRAVQPTQPAWNLWGSGAFNGSEVFQAD
eukprot:407973_1